LRKFSIIALSVFLLMSFTAIAYAIHIPELPEGESVVVSKDSDITLGGRILVRGWYFDNVEWGSGEWLGGAEGNQWRKGTVLDGRHLGHAPECESSILIKVHWWGRQTG